MKAVSFTGHRNITITPKLKKRLYETLESLIQRGATDFYAGGALGWDTLCEKTVLKLGEKYPHIRLHLVLPCPEESQTKNWSQADKTLFQSLSLSAHTTELCSDSDYSGCMKKRNEKLVELADCCVCCYNEKDCASGTGQTVRMAQRQGLEIINLFD